MRTGLSKCAVGDCPSTAAAPPGAPDRCYHLPETQAAVGLLRAAGHRAAVPHLDNSRGNAGRDCIGRQIARDDAPRCHDAAIPHRDPGKDRDSGAKPDARADDDVTLDARLAPHRGPRVVSVVRGGHIYVRAEKGIFADHDSALAVPSPQEAVLTDV